MKAAAFLLAVFLSGCALLQPDAGEAQQVREIVGAAVSTARAAPEEQRRRLAHAQQMYAAVPDDANRVRLAALLVTLPPPWRDDARAADLLEALASRRSESPVMQLAGMLAASVAERQRLARELRAAQARAEEAERRAIAAAERADTLQRQVDALKEIERSILEREDRRRKQQR